jgi:hypothetical protein
MKYKLITCLLILLSSITFAQTKVSGLVVDNDNNPVPYANVVFKGTYEGVVTNEDGRFYLESQKTHKIIVVSFAGFETKEVVLPKAVNYDFKIKISDGEKLQEVVIFSGKTSKKNNPALDILRKIWERKRKNGLRQFNQYQMEKYEKVEFDMNTIDSAFMKSKVFKGMEFIFKQVDTSKVTGKTYLPIFINEALSNVYGDNVKSKVKEILKANKNSGFNTNPQILALIKDLYNEYDIYSNYLKFYDKSFTSPLSRTGIDVYNYVLRDSTFIDKKWCYNIVFYPRRKNELTFKGDFWVNDSTYAIKNINMAVTKSANINWVKDIYIEQEFEVLNDSVFLLTRDYMMTDFALNKKENSKGMYGKRTTLYKNHQFNIKKTDAFYKEEIVDHDQSLYLKPDEFWEENRFENLNKDEKGVYKMLDTLQTNQKFRQIYDLITILGSGYLHKGVIDFGPVLSTVGYNDVEGFRLRFGGRTYFGFNDLWRIQAYTAYGLKDNKFKYGVSGKWLIDKKNRLIIEGGTRRDIEQIGASLTTSNDVLGRNFASSSLFAAGNNGKLTNVSFTSLAVEMEPAKNLTLQAGFSFRTLVSASPDFKLDYYTTLPDAFGNGGISRPDLKQSEINLQIDYTPGRKTIGFAIERATVSSPFPRFFVNYSQGLKGVLNSDFDYKKLQLYYKQPFLIGPVGQLNSIIEVGKTFGEVPLGLLSIVPGNQSYFTIQNTFNLLNFYEFETDQYATIQLEHNFGGRIFARIPYFRKLNWRETIGVKGVYGTISDKNRALNASGLTYNAPEKGYWEYNAGIGNIFKVFKIEFSWRGTYVTPQTNNFGIKGSFGFYF